MGDEYNAGPKSPDGVPSSGPSAKGPPVESLTPLTVASAGLAVFDVIIAVSFLVFWVIDSGSALGIIRNVTGPAILLSLAAIAAGSLVLISNRRHSTVMPGSGWANASVVAGLLLMGVTVALPLISALQVLVGGDA